MSRHRFRRHRFLLSYRHLIAARRASGGAYPRVTTSGAYRVTTDGAYRQYIPAVALPDALLDIRASAAAIVALTDGDPVASWANAGTAGGSFTQSGSARPTKQTIGGYPVVYFDPSSGAQWLLGSAPINAALDNLPSFTVFIVAKYDISLDWNTPILTKVDDIFTTAGWFSDVSASGGDVLAQTDGSNRIAAVKGVAGDAAFRVTTHEIVSFAEAHQYVNGSSSGEDTSGSVGAVTTTHNTEPVRIGGSKQDTLSDNTFSGWIAAIRVYAPAPNASDRAAIEADMAADTGITL